MNFNDNIYIGKSEHGGNDYFAICIREETQNNSHIVWLYRYCVPGRCDIYSFRWNTDSRHLSHFSDFITISESLKIVQRDLRKKKVADFLLKIAMVDGHFSFARILCDQIIGDVAPNSLSYKVLRKYIGDKQKKRD